MTPLGLVVANIICTRQFFSDPNRRVGSHSLATAAFEPATRHAQVWAVRARKALEDWACSTKMTYPLHQSEGAANPLDLPQIRRARGTAARPIRLPAPSRGRLTIDVKCERCHGPLRLIALIKTETIIKRILGAMHLPTQPPQLHPLRPPPGSPSVDGEAAGDSWLN